MFDAERLTGALLDRLTHRVLILSMNGDRHRLAQSTRRRKLVGAGDEDRSNKEIVDPLTGEITPHRPGKIFDGGMKRGPIGRLFMPEHPPRQWPAFAPLR